MRKRWVIGVAVVAVAIGTGVAIKVGKPVARTRGSCSTR